LRAANPGRKIDLEVNGDTCGSWDSQRLQQLLGNLVRNAIEHGAADVPVRVGLNGDAVGVVLEVRNSGPIIEASDLDKIFDPLKRGSDNQNKREADGSLGLGLYIVREIAKGHGGSIEARSDETGTVFAVRLPRSCNK
jgi:signal transduction histidine kinase